MTGPIDPSLPRAGFLIVGVKRNGAKVYRYAWSTPAKDAFRQMEETGLYEDIYLKSVNE